MKEAIGRWAIGRGKIGVTTMKVDFRHDGACGTVDFGAALGLIYRDGQGVPRDPVEAEILLAGAAIGGDPHAVTAVRQMLETEARCPLDRRLYDAWGQVGTMHRNLITGWSS